MRLFGFLLIALPLLTVVSYFVIIDWASDEITNVGIDVTKNVVGDKNKAFAISDWITPSENNAGIQFDDKSWDVNLVNHLGLRSPEITFFMRRGLCLEFAEIFVLMAEAVGMQARVVGTSGESHAWVEIYSNGRWINYDPYLKRYDSYDNPGYYENDLDDGKYHKRLSYVYYRDETGELIDLTKKYTQTGELIVSVTNNGQPSDAEMTIKSHHLKESIGGDWQPLNAFIGTADFRGNFQAELGGNHYTVMAEKFDFPYLTIFRATEEIDLEEGKKTEIELKLQPEVVTETVTIIVIVIVSSLYILSRLIKRKRQQR